MTAELNSKRSQYYLFKGWTVNIMYCLVSPWWKLGLLSGLAAPNSCTLLLLSSFATNFVYCQADQFYASFLWQEEPMLMWCKHIAPAWESQYGATLCQHGGRPHQSQVGILQQEIKRRVEWGRKGVMGWERAGKSFGEIRFRRWHSKQKRPPPYPITHTWARKFNRDLPAFGQQFY